MPRKKSGLYDHKAYQNEYHKAMNNKLLSFNKANKEDMILWEHMMSHENVTAYMKSLIRKDMEQEKTDNKGGE